MIWYVLAEGQSGGNICIINNNHNVLTTNTQWNVI